MPRTKHALGVSVKKEDSLDYNIEGPLRATVCFSKGPRGAIKGC